MSKLLSQQTISVILSFAGIGLMLVAIWWSGDQWGYGRYLAILACLSTIGGLGLLIKQAYENSEAGEEAILNRLRDELTEELQERAELLERQEQALAKKFVTLHQWLEFPQPIDLNETESAESEPSPSELAVKDRKLISLLEQESETLFNNIRANKYAPTGKFDILILREDLLELAERVARIYRPDLERPILETSLSRLLPAASRACLHFLATLDQLPINVKDRSLNSLYGYVQRAVGAYGAYQKAKPLFPYLNSAYYLGRFALGANPLTLGAWWFLGEVGKRSAQAVVTKIVNRQALGLLHNLVRIVGYEVAGIYGGDFRHRDANWIYAVELTDLVRQFPMTSNLLSGSLKELTVIELRCEFDRVFLYRCLAEHHSAGPERYEARELLPTESRHAIAQRLEQFIVQHIHARDGNRINRWKESAEKRLGVQILSGNGPELPEQSQIESALRSLAAFLIVMKQAEVDEVEQYLVDTSCYLAASEETRLSFAGQLFEFPPGHIERPRLDPRGQVVQKFLDDLVALEVRFLPRNLETDDSIFDMAAGLRQDVDQVRRQIEQAYATELAERSREEVKAKSIPPLVAQAILDLLGGQRTLELAVRGITYDEVNFPGKTHWLIGTDQSLYAINVDKGAELVWKGDLSDLRISKTRGLVSSECRIEGGEWVAASSERTPVLRVSGSVFRRFSYFLAANA